MIIAVDLATTGAGPANLDRWNLPVVGNHR